MNISIEDVSDTRKKLSVAVPADAISSEETRLVQEFAKQAKLPGFRPGKAPAGLIKKRYAKDIQNELKSKVANLAFKNAVDEQGLKVYSIVEVDGIDNVVIGEDAAIDITVDLNPEFELPEYTGLELSVDPTDVEDAEVDSTIEEIRKHRSNYEVVEREAQAGDYVKVSYEGFVEDKPLTEIAAEGLPPIFGKQESTWEEAGAEESPGIKGVVDGILGLKAGDKGEAPHEFPADFPVEALRGKSAVYKFEVHEVRERRLPELDEEFFKALQAEDLDSLKERVKSDLETRKTQDVANQKREQIAKALADRVEFALPETAIEDETQSVMREIMSANMQRGVPQDEFEKHKEEIYANSRQTAQQRVKVNTILLRIADKEEIAAENDDFNKIIMTQAMQTRTRPEEIVKELQKDRNKIDGMRRDIIIGKTLDFLIDKASVSVKAADE